MWEPECVWCRYSGHLLSRFRAQVFHFRVAFGWVYFVIVLCVLFDVYALSSALYYGLQIAHVRILQEKKARRERRRATTIRQFAPEKRESKIETSCRSLAMCVCAISACGSSMATPSTRQAPGSRLPLFSLHIYCCCCYAYNNNENSPCAHGSRITYLERKKRRLFSTHFSHSLARLGSLHIFFFFFFFSPKLFIHGVKDETSETDLKGFVSIEKSFA